MSDATKERWERTGKIYTWSNIPVQVGEARGLGFQIATAIRQVSEEEFLKWCGYDHKHPDDATFWELSLD